MLLLSLLNSPEICCRHLLHDHRTYLLAWLFNKWEAARCISWGFVTCHLKDNHPDTIFTRAYPVGDAMCSIHFRNVTYAQVFISCHPEVGSLKFYRYSQEKTLTWLKKKVLMPLVPWSCTCLCVVFPTVTELCVFSGWEDCGCPEKEEHLCGRGSQIYNIYQSKDRVRLQWG